MDDLAKAGSSTSNANTLDKPKQDKFETPHGSTATITSGVTKMIVSHSETSINLGGKRKLPATSREDVQPVMKKNREYLPKASKPLFFELKKYYKKKAQWAAHQAFLENCGATGNPPRSLNWSVQPPWALSNDGLNQKWFAVSTNAPSKLCDVLAVDCAHRVQAASASIQALFNDLGGLVSGQEVTDIRKELDHGFKEAFDKMYAEKILNRSKNATRNASPQKRPGGGKTSTKGVKQQQPRGNQPGPSGAPNKPFKKAGKQWFKNNKNPRNNQGKQSNPPNNKGGKPINKFQLMQQIQQLTKVVKQLND